MKASPASMSYVDQALLGTPKVGTMAWKLIDFPLDQVHIRGKTGSAEVYGKQSTSWVATYDENYVVVMMVSQAGTGSGTSGRRYARSGSRSTASTGRPSIPQRAAIPGHDTAGRTADVRAVTARSSRRDARSGGG